MRRRVPENVAENRGKWAGWRKIERLGGGIAGERWREKQEGGGERPGCSRGFQREEGIGEGRGRLGMTLRGWNSEGWPGSPAFALASCDAEHVAVRRAYVRHDYAFTPLSASILASWLLSPSLYTLLLPPGPPPSLRLFRAAPCSNAIPLFLFFLLLFRLLSSQTPTPTQSFLTSFSRMFLIMPELVPLRRTLSDIQGIECRVLEMGIRLAMLTIKI